MPLPPKNHPPENWFAVMGFAPTPWIDSNQLKARYLELAKHSRQNRHQTAPAAAQPSGNPDPSAVNRAWQVLANDTDRLAHFLELETGKDIRQEREAPETLITLFMQLGPLFQQADRAIGAIREETSPILKAKHHLTAGPLLVKLDEASATIAALVSKNQSRLQTAHQSWLELSAAENPPARHALLDELQDICRALSFLQRWQDRLAEKNFQLTPN